MCRRRSFLARLSPRLRRSQQLWIVVGQPLRLPNSGLASEALALQMKNKRTFLRVRRE